MAPVVDVLGPHTKRCFLREHGRDLWYNHRVSPSVHGELAPRMGEKYVGVLGFDRYVRRRVAGRGRQLASLNICHKKTSQ